MQYPVLLLLIIITFQAIRAYETRAFLYIALGWFANGLSLTTTLLWASLRVPYLGRVDELLDFLSAISFWYAARQYSVVVRLHYPTLGGRSSVWTLPFAVFASFVFVQNIYLPRHFEWLLYLPIALFSVTAILFLAVYFKELADKLEGRSPRLHLVYGATLLYATIQPVRLFFAYPAAGASLLRIVLLTNLVAEVLILAGIVRLLVISAEAFTRSLLEQQESFAKQTRLIDELAHELGTPIGEILSWSRTLSSSAISGEMIRKVEKIESAASRVAAIVHASRFAADAPKPLEMSSDSDEILGGRVLWKHQVVSANTLVEIAQNAVKRTRSENVVYIRAYAASCCLECVPIEIVQVLINVLRNSYDAFSGPRGRIEIRTQVEQTLAGEKGPAHLKIMVRDNGEGIPFENIQKVFGEGYSTRTGLHRGLGLAIARKLVEKNHGTIEVRSPAMYISATAAGGTEVVLTFPRVSCSKA